MKTHTKQRNGTSGPPKMSLLEHYVGQVLVGMGTWCPDGPNADLNDSRVIKNRAKWAIQQAKVVIAELAGSAGTSKTDLEEELIEMLEASAQQLDYASSLLREKDTPGLARILAKQASSCRTLLIEAKEAKEEAFATVDDIRKSIFSLCIETLEHAKVRDQANDHEIGFVNGRKYEAKIIARAIEEMYPKEGNLK